MSKSLTRARVVLIAACLALTSFAASCASMAEPAPRWSLVVHGGAGAIERSAMTPELEAEYRAALTHVLATGGDILDGGGTALDAVQASVMELENNPLFNAGRGAVFSAEGRNELDAAVMDGRTRAAGAVAGVTQTKNPILLARAVMEHSPHVMLIGEGAEQFARSQSLEEVPPSYFFTERRWRQLEEYLRAHNLPIPPRPEGAPAPVATNVPVDGEHLFGTVGVVAYDTQGDIAAGTSTGGTNGKRWGRVGDTPVIGAGTYAQNGVCGVSATGTGEYFIRVGVARSICARMQLRGESVQAATDAVMAEVGALGGDGGVIVLDGKGAFAWRFNTPGMYRAHLVGVGEPIVRIFADEE